MMRMFVILGVVLLAAAAVWWVLRKPSLPGPEVVAAAYSEPVPAPSGPVRVFHLGHSLVGQDIPAMLAQLAPPGHGYESQLGWGTPMKAHWEPKEQINGFDEINAHPRYRDATEAIGSGDYDVVVLTEMVELKDAIKYWDSAAYFSKWGNLAREADPETQVYLYETWHWLTDPEGWTNRLDRDLSELWENGILLHDLRENPDRPAHVIPAGQVLSRFIKEVETRGGIGGIDGAEDLFGIDPEGKLDPIHMGDLGNYIVALTHYAVIYQRSPEGLPHELLRADGTPARAPSAEAARLMQEIVWQTVTDYPKTGVPK